MLICYIEKIMNSALKYIFSVSIYTFCYMFIYSSIYKKKQNKTKLYFLLKKILENIKYINVKKFKK